MSWHIPLRSYNPKLLVRDEIEVKNASGLERIKLKVLPTAYLPSEKYLLLLKGFPEVIVDRGQKHRAKGLVKEFTLVRAAISKEIEKILKEL